LILYESCKTSESTVMRLDKMTDFIKFFLILTGIIFITTVKVFATGAGITYNGRILNPNGDPVQGNSVQFKLQIRTIGSENCLMYEEVQVKVMSDSDGVFTLTINDGSGTRLDSAAYGLDQIFANRGTFSFPTNYCASGNSYAPNPSDGRKLQVYFNDGTIPAGEWEPSPAMAINFIPSAIEAMQVGGYKKEQLLKLADGVSTSGSELDATKWTNLQALLAGSSSQYVTPGSATFTAAPSWSGTPSAGSDLVNKTYVDAQVAAGLPDVGTPGTYGKVTTDAKGRVTSGAALVEADIPTLSTAGKVSGSAINTGTLGGNAAINTTGNLVTTGTVSGQTLSATQLRVYNGSNYLQFTSPTLLGITNFILPPGDSTGTQYLRSDGAGNLSWGSPGSVSLTQATNQGVTITGTGPISLGTVQDIRTTASPTFAGMILNNVATNLTQSVSVGTSYGITWPGSVASTAGSVLTSTTGGLLSWTAAVPAANGGTGQSSYTIGDLLYASTSSALSRLPASTSGYVLTSNGAGTAPSWQAAAGGGGGAISAMTAAASTNSIDNTNYAQTWNWSTATTENPMTLTANALTTGSLLSVSTSNGSLNSTNGLLNVANTGASTSGVLARLQSNSTAGSGLTVLANGNVGIGTSSPTSPGHVYGQNASNGIFQVESSTSGVVFKAGSSTGSMIQMVGGGGTVSVAGGPATARLNVGPLTSGAIPLAINGIVGQTGDLFRVDKDTGTSGQTFVIRADGNVGIGTATPVSRLTVNETNVATSGTKNLSDFSLIVLPPSASTAVNQGFQLKAYNNSTGAYGYGTIRGMSIDSTFTGAATSSATTVEGIKVGSFALGGTATNVTGANILAMGSGSPTTTLTRLTGIDLTTELDGPASTVNMYGVSSNLSTSGTVTSTNRFGFYHNDFNSGTSTNSYGVYIYDDNWGTVTNHYGIFLDTRATATNNWGVYQKVSAAKNYFAGNVGIGTASPEAKLDVTDASTTTSAIIVPRAGTFTGTTVNGMIRYNTTSTLFEFYQNGGWVNYTAVSDGRLKTNVIPITDGLSIVRQLNPVFYDWDRRNPKTSSFEDKHQVGFIAQEVEEVLPEVVNQGEDSYRSLEYGKIVSVAIAAIKELYYKILDIKSDVENLKAKDAAKDREIASVKAENADLKVKAQKAEEENAALKVRLDKIEKALNLK
jgi:hypothetical protein